jgi:hypothetical protein
LGHNEIQDELSDLASKVFFPSQFATNQESIPVVLHSRDQARESHRAQLSSASSKNNCTEDHGDILVQGLWACGTACIIDICIRDIDAKYQRSKNPHKVLEAQEREKKKKYLETCLEQRRHFSPFVASTEGLLGKESRTLLKKVFALLAEKWEKLYSEICGYVNAQMSIAMVRATYRCLWGSCIPTSEMSNCGPQWEDKAGLGLFQR